MSDRVIIKRGATFRIRRGLPIELSGAVFSSSVRAMGSGRKIADLNCREIDVSGGKPVACILELEAPTNEWPLTILSADIKAVAGSEVIYSSTIQIEVVRNVTTNNGVVSNGAT